MSLQKPKFQKQGDLVRAENQQLIVPPHPVIPYLTGDGIGPEIWQIARKVLDTAVDQTYKSSRSIQWFQADQNIPINTPNGINTEILQIFKDHVVGIKGPLATLVGKGHRSLNYALRRALDLYVCLRPVRWISGVPAPVVHPNQVDMVVFRENTEDLYAGIEYQSGSSEQAAFMELFRKAFPADFDKIRHPGTSSIALKPISMDGSYRLVRAAITWALQNQRKSVTLVHKGNVMKFTEGSFLRWGYEIASNEFKNQVFTMQEWTEIKQTQGVQKAEEALKQALGSGKLIIKDKIADAMFAAVLSQPAAYDVIATTNVNGDYLSDALAGQVGGLGLAPGGNINFESGHAIFEATHGTAPDIAGKGIANPTSLILSGEMMLRHLGWNEAANLTRHGVEETIKNQILTADLQMHVPSARPVSSQEFGEAVIQAILS